MRLYERIGEAFPRRVRIWTKKQVDYSSFSVNADELIGFSVLFGGGMGVVGGLLLSRLANVPPIGGVLLSFVGFVFLIYLWIDFSASSKAKFVEDVLPDALQIISSNIRAGLTIDKAILMTARDEFGPLGDEIRRIGKETMAGESIIQSMLKTKRKVRSKHMEMTINLIVQSIESGGELSDLLNQTANDLREQQIIQKEIRASVLMYVFFVFIAIGLGAPLLFAVSSMLVKILSTNMALIASELPSDFAAMGNLPISMTRTSISQEFIARYVTISLLITSFFGAVAVGLILNGEEKAGLKFFPILGVLSLGLYKIAFFILDHFVGNLMHIGA